MKLISITGISGAGKTTVAESLIKELLTRGFTVGTVKDIHAENFSIDSDGKNTHMHRVAGATTVTAYSAHETAVMYTERLPLEKLLTHYKEDFVILEGLNTPSAKHIAVSKENESPIIFENTVAISGRIANQNGRIVLQNLPVINAVTDAVTLVNLILEN